MADRWDKNSSVQVEKYSDKAVAALLCPDGYGNRYFQIPPEPHGGYREHNKPFHHRHHHPIVQQVLAGCKEE